MAAPHFEVHPFLLGVDDVAKQLDTTQEKGLSDTQVQERQAVYGPNQLQVAKTAAWHSILVKQFCNAMIIVLFIILAVSFGVGDVVEGSVVGGVILINVGIGFVQESRAEKKMDALRSLSSPSATVVRNGRSQTIPNSEVVPGDVVMLRMGDTVPADVRLFECVNLSCDEQPFLGAARRAGDLLLRLLGIAGCTPLQRLLPYMSYTLFLCAVLITIIVFAVHRFQLSSDVVLYATSTGIVIIPESLAIVLVMSMVQAVRVMRKANVVVRYGSRRSGVARRRAQHLLISAALCNAAAVLRRDGEPVEWVAIGDPTEISLQVLSMRFGMGKSSLEAGAEAEAEAEGGGRSVGGWKRLAEFPFDSSIKRMSVVCARPAEAGQDGQRAS